jgi:hypothetical protein
MSYLAHAVVENRHGLAADGTAEREASVLLSEFPDSGGRITWGGDKAYDTVEHVALVRELGATPHRPRTIPTDRAPLTDARPAC